MSYFGVTLGCFAAKPSQACQAGPIQSIQPGPKTEFTEFTEFAEFAEFTEFTEWAQSEPRVASWGSRCCRKSATAASREATLGLLWAPCRPIQSIQSILFGPGRPDRID